VARFIQLARKILPRTLFLNVSFVGSAALAGLLGAAGEGVIITQVVPPPSDKSIAAVRAYSTDLEAYRKDLLPDFVSLEGYLVARLFVAALERAGAEPTRQSVLEAMAGLTELDLGLGQSVGFPPGEHTLSPRRVWPTRVVVENGKPEIRPMRWDDLHVG
jgi:ABC-type branched-subunit amino acid transport system substrate-binding protein